MFCLRVSTRNAGGRGVGIDEFADGRAGNSSQMNLSLRLRDGFAPLGELLRGRDTSRRRQRKPKGAKGGAMNAHHIPIGFFMRESLSW